MTLHRVFRITSKDLWRGIAFFLLTFVVSDLAILDVLNPEHCAEMLVGCNTQSSHPSHLQAPTDPAPAQSDLPALQGASSRVVQTDLEGDDCTCLSCCAHVLPAAEYHWVSVSLPDSRSAPVGSWLPTTLPKQPFHPPRFC